VHGDSVAGGCELALHCDIRVAADDARFSMPLARIGLAVPVLLTDTALDLVFVWAVLRLFDRERRFKQTATALLGADTLLNLLSLPLVLWNQSLEGATAPALLFLLLAIWSIDIAGFVLSRTLERPYALGVAIMLGYVLLSISLRMSFFPTTS
jgi:hypothetical protein